MSTDVATPPVETLGSPPVPVVENNHDAEPEPESPEPEAKESAPAAKEPPAAAREEEEEEEAPAAAEEEPMDAEPAVKEASSEDAKDHSDQISESSTEAPAEEQTDSKPEPEEEEKQKPEPEEEKQPEPEEKKQKVPEKTQKTPKKSSPKKKDTPKKESPRKSPKKTESAAVAESATDDKPLLEAPLVVEGKRRRQTVQRLEATASPYAAVKSLEIPEGSGDKLGDMEYVEAMISKKSADDLKTLHKICFGTPGKSTMIKRHLRQFFGFSFDATSDEYNRKLKLVEKYHVKDIKGACEVLGLERSGKREDLAAHIMEFLVKPSDSGRKAPKSKKRKSAGRKSSSKGAKSSKSSDKASSDDGEESGEESDQSEEAEAPPPKKKKKMSPPAKATPKKKGRPAKKSGPTDTELKTAVKGLLKGINLEEVTMKEMCKMVYDKFPDVDLTERKDFIKTTVKSIISGD